MTIGVTDNMGSERKLSLYYDWLRRADPSVQIVNLSYAAAEPGALATCDGILLTGGGDVDPKLYGGDDKDSRLHGVDRKRDDFEREVIDHAVRHGVPLLGICRGLQIANVHFGGTLIPDLPEAGHQGHTSGTGQEQRHPVNVAEDSLLKQIAGATGDVNSYHHQAADQPGPGLRITGHSSDGVAEAIEPLPGTLPSFFLLVQWHPERMKDFGNTFCHAILQTFLLQSRTRNTPQ